MATFEVPVKRIKAIEEHPNADLLQIAVIDGYRSIIKKNQYRAGDLVAYIPEGAVLPEDLLKVLGFWNEEKGRGTLNGTLPMLKSVSEAYLLRKNGTEYN